MRPRRRCVIFGVAVVLAAACSSSTKSTSTPRATTTTLATATAADRPVYAKHGPYEVGYTTLHLPDRDVAVWYPADAASVAGKPKASYDQATPLPKNMKGLVPPKYNTVVTMDAYDGVPASTKGPFPVLLFSHGYGGYRLANSALAAGIASWGFVVVSVDYLERGLAAQVGALGRSSTKQPTPAEMRTAAERDRKLMLAGLDLVTAENTRAGSVLHGAVDASKVGVAGHSAGGGTAFNALNDPRVKVAIGWAPVPPSGTPADKPTMIIGAGADSALTPAALAQTYASFPPPKRLVEIGGARAGHNTFTDVCVVIRQGGGLVKFALDNHFITPGLAKLALNGCAASDMAPQDFWPIVQHFTVAELRSALGIDPQPVGLGDGIVHAFGSVPVTYRHEP